MILYSWVYQTNVTAAQIPYKNTLYFQGTKGLSLFYVEVRKEDGRLNNIEVIRLKNKLGTRQLPTAELLLDGTVAQKVIISLYGL